MHRYLIDLHVFVFVFFLAQSKEAKYSTYTFDYLFNYIVLTLIKFSARKLKAEVPKL